MLNGIPFGSAGRVASDGDSETEVVAELALDLILPSNAGGAVAAAGIDEDEDVVGVGVAAAPFRLPLLLQASDGEIGTQADRGSVFIGISHETF